MAAASINWLRDRVFGITEAAYNGKTGGLLASRTNAHSCPDNCSFKTPGEHSYTCGKQKGCYACSGPEALHWRMLTEGRGKTFNLAELAASIKRQPPNTLVRLNTAGDLPGTRDEIHPQALEVLKAASVGRRVYTYTHKPLWETPKTRKLNIKKEVIESNRRAVAEANQSGLTINVSTETTQEADRAFRAGLPTVMVVPEDTGDRRNGLRTPGGVPVVVCPQSYNKAITCQKCGVCAIRDRKFIIGFPVHGKLKGRVTTIAAI